MDLNYFKTFITVVDQKGFSQAAKLLNLTQPAVSFQVQSLEKHYQITLIDRSSYKFKLTEVGQIFYKTSKKLLDTEKKLSDEVDTYKEKVGGELILGASNIPGEYILPGILGKFKKINPEVKVSLEIGDTAEIIDNIIQHHIDLGFIGSVPDKGNLEYKKFKTDELLLVVPKGHTFLKKPFTLDDLCSEAFIIREEGSGTRKTLEESLKKKKRTIKDLNSSLELGSTRATISAVEAGLGITVISRWALPEISSLKSISTLRIPFLNLKRDIFLVYNPKAPLSSSQKQFIKFLKK